METTAPARLIGRAFAALALALLPTTALAETPQPASPGLRFAKSEAILGGAPSALAAILAQQQGLPPPAPLQPAALSVRTPRFAELRTLPSDESGVTSGRPDVFGTVALSVNRTPLDHRWRKVARVRVAGAPASYAAALRDFDELERIEAVNRYVNRRVSFVDDARQYGSSDLWTAAGETLRRGRGDCEDYAIAKLQMLRAAGFSDGDLYLVVVKDLVRRADHAILVVRAAGRMLVLDNGTDVVTDAYQVRDYRPILTFAANGAWTHGYRRATPPLTVAAASVAPLAPAGAAGRSN